MDTQSVQTLGSPQNLVQSPPGHHPSRKSLVIWLCSQRNVLWEESNQIWEEEVETGSLDVQTCSHPGPRQRSRWAGAAVSRVLTISTLVEEHCKGCEGSGQTTENKGVLGKQQCVLATGSGGSEPFQER